jgi:16S rRNA C967 or C1407 C5-methylase (RsmB/RsmF family)
VIVEACAAPGNKATHLQALAMQPGGCVVAVERDAKRADRLRATVKRMNARSVKVVQVKAFRVWGLVGSRV